MTGTAACSIKYCSVFLVTEVVNQLEWRMLCSNTNLLILSNLLQDPCSLLFADPYENLKLVVKEFQSLSSFDMQLDPKP